MGRRGDLIHIFITESREYIDLLDQKIIQMESEPDNGALLDEIFRAFHTLKGNSGLVGMKRFEKVAHITEEVLTQIRDGKRDISSEVVNFLLDSLDQLKILHDAIEKNGDDAVTLEKIAAPAENGVKKNTKPSAKTPARKSKGKPATKSSNAKAAKSGNKAAAQSQASSESTENAEDGSWGIFTDNLEADRAAPEPSPAAETTAPAPATAESKPGSVPEGWSKGDSSIRVDVSLLDSLMNMVGELAPYGIAMKIAESGLFNDWLVRIIATDISSRALEQSKDGIYTQMEVSRGLPVKMLIKHFSQVGDIWKIKDDLKKTVTFRHHVLQDPAAALGTFDIVFCRNVLIYFDLKTKQKILDRINKVMTNDGLLALGGSETTLNISRSFEGLRLADATFYIKAGAKTPW